MLCTINSLHEVEFAQAGGSLTVGEVTLHKDVQQLTIRLANICGSVVQSVLSGDP